MFLAPMVGDRPWRAGLVRSSAFQMQRIGADLHFSATLGQEPEVELALF
jgi:hypothetical protein